MRDSAGPLVGQAALVGSQAPADEAVPDAGLFQAVVQDVQQHGHGRI